MAAYGQRTDLNMAPTAVPGQTYGEAGAQMAAQRAVPMGAPAAPATPSAPTVAPGQYGPLDRPTERPNEPLTAGAPFGPGRMSTQSAYIGRRNGDPILDELRALYASYPSDELADMLDSDLREGY
jgi:hypothetical protein